MIKKEKRSINFSGIKVKLVLALVLICIIPLSAVGFITYEQAYNKLESTFKLTTQQTLGEVNREINYYFNGLVKIENMLASNPFLQQLSTNPEYEQYARDYLKNVKESNPDIELINFVLMDKKIVNFPVTTYDSKYDPTQRAWYKGAMQDKGKVVVSEPFKSASSGKQVVSLSKTVEFNGQIVGIVMFTIDLEKLSKELTGIAIGKQGYIYIATSNGFMVVHKNGDLIGTDEVTKQTFWNDAKVSQKGISPYSYLGVDKYAVYDTNELVNWKIIATINKSELLEDTNSIKNLVVISIGVVFILAVFIALLISNSIASNARKLQTAFRRAAGGDLQVRTEIKTKDELGILSKDFNEMISNIGALIRSLKSSSEVIMNASEAINAMSNQSSSAVNEVALTVNQVAEGSQEQAQDIGLSVDSMDNLALNIDDIESLAAKVESMSKDTNILSESGLKFMELLMIKTQEGNMQTENVSSVVMDMNKSSEEIGLITDTINSIADQTNLLALNAAIEAARAGEAGRGFTVVAEEIRKLAEQSSIATKQIQDLITKIKNKSSLAVAAISETKVAVSAQSESVNESMKIFKNISESIKTLLDEITGIKSAIDETKQKKDDIIIKMQNISAVAEESSASTEEVSAAIEEVSATIAEFINAASKLKELSDNLEVEIGRFKLD